MDEGIKDILNALKKENDPLRKALRVIAVLTEDLEPEGIRPILVGGVALEFYTLGGYATKDIDLVVSDRSWLSRDALTAWIPGYALISLVQS